MRSLKCLLLLLLVVLIACDKGVRATFVVINKSGQDIDSVSIMPDVQPQYKSIEKGERTKVVIDMTGIARVDGAYGLQYKRERLQRLMFLAITPTVIRWKTTRS